MNLNNQWIPTSFGDFKLGSDDGSSVLILVTQLFITSEFTITLKHSSYRSLQLIFPLFKIDLSRKLGTNRKYRRLIFLIILYAKKPVRSYACSLKFSLLKICPLFGYTIWDSDLHILLRHHAIQVLVCLQFSPRTCCSKWIIIVLPYILLAKMFIVDLLYL